MRSLTPANRRLALTAVVVCGIAAILRFLPLLVSGGLVHAFEYDGAVMFGATLATVSGRIPYADFAYLHPPGFLVISAPMTWFADALGEQAALAAVRALMATIGVVNTALIALLLRKRGGTAVLIGAGAYAVWPVVTFTERMVMLEPLLNLFLLLALLALRWSRGGVWLAGALIGLAVTVKLWAVVDVIVIGGLVLAQSGLRALWRYAAAGTLCAALIGLPFFLLAPAGMWQQVVTAQLTRPPTDTGLAERINMLSAFFTVPALDRLFPWWSWAALWIALIVVASVPLVSAFKRRLSPREWDDSVWWSLLALAHGGVLVVTSVFYNHYAIWFVAPVCLAVGAAVSSVRSGRNRRLVTATASAALGVVAVAQLWSVEPVPERAVLQDWAATHECVWADSTALVAANVVRRNVQSNCDFAVDPFGAWLVERARNPKDARAAEEAASALLRDQALKADALILPTDRRSWRFRASDRPQITSEFVETDTDAGLSLWVRRER